MDEQREKVEVEKLLGERRVYLRYPKRTDVVAGGKVIMRTAYRFGRGTTVKGMLTDPVRLRCEKVGLDACGGVLIICDDSERGR